MVRLPMFSGSTFPPCPELILDRFKFLLGMARASFYVNMLSDFG
jgi:hypothetical protein